MLRTRDYRIKSAMLHQLSYRPGGTQLACFQKASKTASIGVAADLGTLKRPLARSTPLRAFHPTNRAAKQTAILRVERS